VTEKEKKEQWNVRVSVELQDRLNELGARLGLSGNQFAGEILKRYAEVLYEVMADEEKAHEMVREAHRQQLKERLQSSMRE